MDLLDVARCLKNHLFDSVVEDEFEIATDGLVK